jgi:hypothetical protein
MNDLLGREGKKLLGAVVVLFLSREMTVEL